MKRMGYDFTKESGLNFGKKNEHYFVHLYQKAKTPITTIRQEKDSVM